MTKIEYKAWREFKAVDRGPGGFEGYGSLFGIRDEGNDIVEAGAFRNTLATFIKDGFIADGHNWNSVSDGAIGTIVDAHEDARGLFIRTEYHSTQRAQDARKIAMERLARGKSVGLSIGYGVRPGGEAMDATGVRRLLDLDLFEVSHVNVPMLRSAGMTAAKSGAATVAQPALPPAPPTTGRYVAVAWFQVDGDIRRAAQEAADHCADELSIKRRDVRFFDDATPDRLVDLLAAGARNPERFDVAEADDCLGVYRPDTPNCIWVKATLDPATAAEVAAHETRHRWQYLARGRPFGTGEVAAYEVDARAFSDQYAARLARVGGGISW